MFLPDPLPSILCAHRLVVSLHLFKKLLVPTLRVGAVRGCFACRAWDISLDIYPRRSRPTAAHICLRLRWPRCRSPRTRSGRCRLVRRLTRLNQLHTAGELLNFQLRVFHRVGSSTPSFENIRASTRKVAQAHASSSPCQMQPHHVRRLAHRRQRVAASNLSSGVISSGPNSDCVRHSQLRKLFGGKFGPASASTEEHLLPHTYRRSCVETLFEFSRASTTIFHADGSEGKTHLRPRVHVHLAKTAPVTLSGDAPRRHG
mmetsp:Transcript_27471/g.72334  ORF Transcript_27471/g.72334 Transcript_27471/m.72334 type:complete len:259 (+) Transcript_27471:449-1225(+)